MEMLEFKQITLNDLPVIKSFLYNQTYRTCDFTIGGIYMWVSYFKYEYAIYKDTLFIKGVSEDNLSKVAFSLPLGALSLADSLEVLHTYCKYHHLPFLLSAVPEAMLEQIPLPHVSKPLEDWFDYVYNIEDLAELKGKKYSKKRNHVNSFRASYPDYSYERIDESNLPDVLDFYQEFCRLNEKGGAIFNQELSMTCDILKHYFYMGFVGACMRVDGKVVAFTMGEIIEDVLYVHIEKADRNLNGLYEMINMSFSKDMKETYPSLAYINREEDAGDPGLRKAKESYHPVMLLNKYNVLINDYD